MKRVLTFTKRNFLKVVRDPLSLVFCLAFPIIMLVLMELIFGAIPNSEATMFEIENFAPGIASFGYTFTMLFIALTIAADKNSSFLTRILVSPAKPFEYFISFVLSALPICLVQTILFYLVSLIFGLKVTGGLFVSMVYLIPSALFYISVGLLIGAIVKTAQQAGPMSSIIITAAGLLGGVWMPVESIGGGFLKASECMPFYNGVNVAKKAIMGDFAAFFPGGIIVLAYAIVFFTVSVVLFNLSVKKK